MIDFTDFDLDAIPATTAYSVRGKRAIVWHPAGPAHENAALTALRLRRSGFTVSVGDETFRPLTPTIPAPDAAAPPWKVSGK